MYECVLLKDCIKFRACDKSPSIILLYIPKLVLKMWHGTFKNLKSHIRKLFADLNVKGINLLFLLLF